MRDDIDVLLLQDTRVPESLDWRLAGYNQYILPNTDHRSGCMIVVKTSIPHQKITNPIHCGNEVEIMALRLKLPAMDLVVYNIYRKRDQLLDMGQLLRFATNHPCLIAGDFNAHHPLLHSLSATNAAGIHLARLLEDINTVKLLNDGQPTHVRGGRLDLTIVTAALATGATWTLHQTLTSDHFATITDLHVDAPDIPLPPPKWNTKKADWNLFRTTMDAWWNSYDPCNDLNQREADFTEAITRAADIAIPKTKPAKRKSRDWWFYTPEVREVNRRLTDARKWHQRNPCQETVAFLRNVAQHKREVVREQRTICWLKWCESISHNTTLGTLWKQLKTATGRPPPRRPAHDDPQGEAERLADLLVARSSTDLLPMDVQLRQRELQPARNRALQQACLEETPTDQPFAMQELLYARKGRQDTASGSDGITYSMLQCAGSTADEAYLSLINLSWEEGKMPHSWKDGDIVVVEKPGATLAEPKLRPLTLLKCPGKTAESMVQQRLIWQIGPLHPNVFGFVKGSGTTECITAFLAHIDNSSAIAVFLDLEKAFELASPTAMLDGLLRKGVRGKMLTWLADYFTNRRSRVRFQGKMSEYRLLPNGTPQGALLSPTAFNSMMEQLVSLPFPRGAQLLSYADDLVLVVSKVGNKAAIAQRSLDMISMKCRDLGLKISAAKSKAMYLFPPPNYKDRALRIQGRNLEWVHKHLYLGVWIDQKLTFKAEIEYLRAKMSARVDVMKAMTHHTGGASEDVLRLFYIQAVRSLADYAAPTLNCAAPTWMDEIEKVQNAAMRVILGAPRWTKIETMQAETGLIPLGIRTQQLVACHIAKFHQRNIPRVVCARLAGRYHLENNSKTWKQRSGAAYSAMLGEDLQRTLTPDCPDPTYQQPPPWTPSVISFSYTALPGSKRVCSNEEMRQLALQNMEALNTGVVYYTDGSVNPDTGAAASAFVVGDVTIAWRNSDNISSLQTELAAIEGALLNTEGGPGTTITIHTDSKAAVQTLQRRHVTDNKQLITSILSRAILLKERGTSITVNWIPSHVGVAGNDKADTAAKLATELPTITKQVRPSLSWIKGKAREAARSITRNKHQIAAATSASMRWYQQATNNCPLIKEKHWTRATTTAIHRLRLGYRTLAEIDPTLGTLLCQHCGLRAEQPTLHYLNACPATVQLRNLFTEGNGLPRAEDIIKEACLHIETLVTVVNRAPPPR